MGYRIEQQSLTQNKKGGSTETKMSKENWSSGDKIAKKGKKE